MVVTVHRIYRTCAVVVTVSRIYRTCAVVVCQQDLQRLCSGDYGLQPGTCSLFFLNLHLPGIFFHKQPEAQTHIQPAFHPHPRARSSVKPTQAKYSMGPGLNLRLAQRRTPTHECKAGAPLNCFTPYSPFLQCC